MSRTMQLVVEVKAHYPHSLAESYPNLARHLQAITPGFLGPEPSLLEICARLDELQGRLAGTALGQLIEAKASELRLAQRRVEELAADWKLEQADQLLYQIEDRFDELEAELGRA
jgi:hypothetical protein